VLKANFASAAEATVRAAVACCAPHVLLPPLPSVVRRLNIELNVSVLTPSIRKRVSIVDKRDQIWNAISGYFGPVFDSLRIRAFNLHHVIWNTYMLVLATRQAAQLHMNVSSAISELDDILEGHKTELSSEAAARLSVVRGILTSLGEPATLPGLVIRAGPEIRLRERLDEILEDAYLLEASVMRRFLSFEANKASMRRDLRAILRALSRSRKWAKGVVDVAEQTAILPRVATGTAEKLLELGNSKADVTGPVLLDEFNPPWKRLFKTDEYCYTWQHVIRTLTADRGIITLIEHTTISAN
jgi:hypothetical protein